ncbi:MAG: diacylglycerol kinase family lipid kinase [Actinomycetota bacterium]
MEARSHGAVAPAGHHRGGAGIDVVPLGTGNLLAANLGIPSGLDAASDAGRAPVRQIDLAYANGEAFAVMAGSGFDALMIRDADDTTKSRLGTLAYVLSAIRHLRLPLVLTTVVVDGKPWFTGRTSMVLVANHGTMSGGLDVFPDAAPDDGLLDVGVLAATGVRQWAGVFLRLLAGRAQSSDLVRMTQGRTISVRTNRPRAWELDGEDRAPTTDLEFTLQPGALRVHDRNDRSNP